MAVPGNTDNVVMAQNATAPMVRLHGFEKWYGEIHAVKGIDLDIQRGEAFVLLGSNGCGKSTILRAIAGLHAPSAGSVQVAGLDVAREPLQVKRNLAYLPQRIDFPHLLTGREILRFYSGLKGVDEGRVDNALEFISLSEYADRATKGYSGGMLQRLALGITFLKEVPLLLLDEPTLNLDPTGMRRFRQWIHEVRDQGVTVIFTSHILQESLRLADRVAVMSEGEVIQVLEVAGFRERVLSATVVRVVVDSLTDAVIEAAHRAGATEDSRNEKSFTFKAPPESRQRVIRAMEDAGGLIEELHTEPPDWDLLVEILSETEEDG